jgi:ABC-type transport system involved in cytochrome c biogenesis permease subunit
LHVPVATATLRNKGVSAHVQDVVKTAWYGDMRFKQRAVIEFLVVKRESVTNIPKRIKCVYTLSLFLMKVILVAGLHELQIFHPSDLTNC